MSDRLAVSASLSVLMMSIYVLFSADATRVPFSPDELRAPAGYSAPASLNEPGQVLNLID